MGENLQQKAKRILKAANKGNPKAQYNAGIIYLKGLGVIKDVKKALEWFDKAKSNEYWDAYFTSGYIYYHGLTGKNEQHKALNDFIVAARNGKDEAFDFIDKISQKIDIYENQEKKLLELYKPKAKQGDKNSQKWVASYYFKRKDFLSQLHFKYWNKKYKDESLFNIEVLKQNISNFKPFSKKEESNERFLNNQEKIPSGGYSENNNFLENEVNDEKFTSNNSYGNNEIHSIDAKNKKSHEVRDFIIAILLILFIGVLAYRIGDAVFFTGETSKKGTTGSGAKSDSDVSSTSNLEEKLVQNSDIIDNMKEFYLINRIIHGISISSLIDDDTEISEDLTRKEFTYWAANQFFNNGVIKTYMENDSNFENEDIQFLNETTNYLFSNIDFTDKPLIYRYELSQLYLLQDFNDIYAINDIDDEKLKEAFSIFYYYLIKIYGYEVLNEFFENIIQGNGFHNSTELVFGKTSEEINQEFTNWSNQELNQATLQNRVFLEEELEY